GRRRPTAYAYLCRVNWGKGRRAMGCSMARRGPRQVRVPHQPSGGHLWRRRRTQEHGRRANRATIGATSIDAQGMEAEIEIFEGRRLALCKSERRAYWA